MLLEQEVQKLRGSLKDIAVWLDGLDWHDLNDCEKEIASILMREGFLSKDDDSETVNAT